MEHARSKARKREILNVARTLLIERGLNGTSIAEVANRSGAAVGSVTHFYKTKDALAAAVAEEVIGAVVADAEAALTGHDSDVERAVRSLLAACSRWPREFPHYQRLARYTESDPPMTDGPGAQGLQVRLEKVLVAWARPLIAAKRVVRLSSAQLYAILIAPVLSDTTNPAEAPHGKQDDWIGFLSSAALKAIVPQDNAAGAPKRKTGSRPERGLSGPGDLFGQGAA
jgi:AcrR family transcriptional regulator